MADDEFHELVKEVLYLEMINCYGETLNDLNALLEGDLNDFKDETVV